jgi:hypothetical protein
VLRMARLSKEYMEGTTAKENPARSVRALWAAQWAAPVQGQAVKTILDAVLRAWGNEHPDEKPPRPIRMRIPEELHDLAEEAIPKGFEGVDLLHAEAVEVKEEHWAVVFEKDAVRLARLSDDGALEIKYLGPLVGGRYREMWRSGGDSVDVVLDHPLLSLKLEKVKGELRGVFRRWAETPSPAGTMEADDDEPPTPLVTSEG